MQPALDSRVRGNDALSPSPDNLDQFLKVASRAAKSAVSPVDSHWMNPRVTQSIENGQRQSSFVTVNFKSGVLTIKPAGPSLGEREVTIISADVRPAMAKCSSKLRAVILDLGEVQIMSSYGLGWCIEVRNAARLINAKTVLFGLHRELLDLIRMMKVERLYTIVHSAGDLASATAG